MNRIMWIVCVAVVCGATGALAVPNPFMGKEFSADTEVHAAGTTMTGKFFVSKDRSRAENSRSIGIIRYDKNIMWTLMPERNMYMELPLNKQQDVSVDLSKPVQGESERQNLGSETLNGRRTTKYRIVYEANGQRETILEWMDDEMSFPIKLSREDGSWSMEYKNFHVGPQPASLFEVPAGYTPLTMPGAGSLSHIADIIKQNSRQ